MVVSDDAFNAGLVMTVPLILNFAKSKNIPAHIRQPQARRKQHPCRSAAATCLLPAVDVIHSACELRVRAKTEPIQFNDPHGCELAGIPRTVIHVGARDLAAHYLRGGLTGPRRLRLNYDHNSV